ncbi:MAG TPA: alpha-L-glutamate ligase-like protein [Gemmataceae bacterium]|nr:alpha-L-glutamate ligase-like protein [Gemmataceae bacterium]
MFWLFGAKRLKELGILTMNRRNADCILARNPRSLFPVVDDKRRMHGLCRRIGVPSPELFAVIESHSQLRQLEEILDDYRNFVLKPNRGAAGRGVLIVTGRYRDGFRRHDGKHLTLEDLRQHLCDILSGMYSLGGHPDSALIQQRVRLHPDFAPICYRGIPDIRVVLYRDVPALAMLRLPTRESNGRANLHQGGIGAGIDLSTGVTHHAVQRHRFLTRHPDTRETLLQRQVPQWREVLAMTQRVSRAVGLGYVGVDVVIDAELGPMLLEANARPGLAIQLANACGLEARLKEIDQNQ